MGINIKNAETQRLIRELVELTGESMTAAVTEAVRERLKRVRREHDPDRVNRWMAIAKDAAKRWKEPYKSTDHCDLLYDERGLPK
jgi:antitoxin VapB